MKSRPIIAPVGRLPSNCEITAKPAIPTICTLALFLLLTASAAATEHPQKPVIEIWHGDYQRIGHLGQPQRDFNVQGHVEPWRETATLEWSLNQERAVPLSFRAFRRLVADGDFNADIPISQFRPGTNSLTIQARLSDGQTVTRTISVSKESGSSVLPYVIHWRNVTHPQDVGQCVDGRWVVTRDGLRTEQVGYDRVFLIGDGTWQDYDVRTTFTVHAVASETTPLSGGAGVGLIARFNGHVNGGPRQFPSAQPKWGYQPFGAIGWLRWGKGKSHQPPQKQFYPGDSDAAIDFGDFAFRVGQTYAVRFDCHTLPDDSDGRSVTNYRFKLWPDAEPEPKDWSWQQTLASQHALRAGALALVAHHADVTYGDVSIKGVQMQR